MKKSNKQIFEKKKRQTTILLPIWVYFALILSKYDVRKKKPIHCFYVFAFIQIRAIKIRKI